MVTRSVLAEVSSSSPSLASQMREKHAAGMSVGDVGRLFGRSYHYAYQVCVVHGSAQSRATSGPTSSTSSLKAYATSKMPAAATSSQGSNTDLLIEELKELSWNELFAITEATPHGKAEVRINYYARAECDRRDESGKWLDKAAAWAKKHEK